MCKNASTVVNRQVSSDEPPPKGHWMVPFERNESFVGREDIMRDILHRILPGKFRDTCQQTVVEGLGGVGKTQIALEAAFQLRELNPSCSVFWVPAIDAIGFENAYKRIAKRLGILTPSSQNASITGKVKDALSNEDAGEWLLIIDNADDPKLLFDPGFLASYLPLSPSGSILFTTRTSEITSRLDTPSAGTFVINAMSKDEATAVMCTKLSASQMGDTHSLDCLLETLAYLPLALKQAASYMQKTKATPTAYLQQCQLSDESFIKLLTKDFMDKTLSQDSDYGGQAENAVAKTWLISFNHVRTLDPMAGDILEFLCFLSDKDIPLSTLPPEYKDQELQEAIGVLQSYAFITVREGGQSLNMHRLVRLATQNWLEENGTFVQAYDPVLLRLTDLLKNYQQEDHNGWTNGWTKLMPHAQSVVNNNNRSNNFPARFRMLLAFSIAIYLENKFAVAVGYMREAEMIGLTLIGESHIGMISIRNILGQMLHVSGHTAEGLEMLRRNHRTSQKKGGQVNSQTLCCAVYRASVMSDPAEAEAILQETLQSQKRILGEEHEDTVLTKRCLVSCLLELSRYGEAEGIAREVLSRQLIEPGEKDLATIETMQKLSVSLLRQGLFEEAEQVARRSYLMSVTTMGTESQLTCNSLAVLANVFVRAGKYQQAEGELRSWLKVQESISQEEQPQKLSCMCTLGYCLIETAKYRDGAEILQEAKERCFSFYGEEHKVTIHCIKLLQLLQTRLDRDVDAEGSKVGRCIMQ